ncbi:hypothetical protein GUITHDRAFT_143390 [Guillardia theta CCMP2712]|uniref:Uncharacterized protein n=1 Tax=Guillardia theta (strain CCMP2712) TaxID=905079 RepID=L1IU19_GUITC|nr:hypothetical protein GUITHDRAFT_143390 [Guillardia theta CCMP2712]EKX39612.1 hypothetical protein GUITHDRAFT_143390 [Guillardia theta CCMP2712]|eukprot:XP_005826592.1 hypothetical protein GUITHDRAFT_143390 [Guillardia theta CCMP2712]
MSGTGMEQTMSWLRGGSSSYSGGKSSYSSSKGGGSSSSSGGYSTGGTNTTTKIVLITIGVVVWVMISSWWIYKRVYLPWKETKDAQKQVAEMQAAADNKVETVDTGNLPIDVFELDPQQAHAYCGLDPANKI